MYGGDWDEGDSDDGCWVVVRSYLSSVIKVYGGDWDDDSDGWEDCG